MLVRSMVEFQRERGRWSLSRCAPTSSLLNVSTSLDMRIEANSARQLTCFSFNTKARRNQVIATPAEAAGRRPTYDTIKAKSCAPLTDVCN